jgi:hypothetical protein
MSQANIQDKIQAAIEETTQLSAANAGSPSDEAQISGEGAHVSDEEPPASREEPPALHEEPLAAHEEPLTVHEEPQGSAGAAPVSDEAVQVSDEQSPDPAMQAQPMLDMQKAMFEAFQQMHRDWVEKAQTEVRLASELSAKLTGVRSVPEATAAYRDWWNERLNIMAEDGRRFCANAEKLISTGERYLGNGSGAGHGRSE